MNISKATLFLDFLGEKWGTDTTVNPEKKGMWDGWSQADLRKEYDTLKSQGPHTRNSASATRMRQINFALRAKRDWGSAGTS